MKNKPGHQPQLSEPSRQVGAKQARTPTNQAFFLEAVVASSYRKTFWLEDLLLPACLLRRLV